MGYFLAPSLVQLRNEVNAMFPHRDKSSDGWIGDASHAARVSSHNPLWSAPGKWSGVVRALDIDIDDNDASKNLREILIKSLVGDPRVWYVISNGVIWSATYGFQARRYTGTNGHYAHVHVSLKETTAAWSDTSKWLSPQAPAFKVKPGPVDARVVINQFRIAAGLAQGTVKESNDVGRIQLALNRQINAKLKVDGYCGEATLNAWKRWEAKHGGVGRPRIPDRESLTALAQGRFRLENVPWKAPRTPVVSKSPDTRDRIDVLVTWNVYVGSSPVTVAKGLRTIVRRHNPDVIALQEVSGDIPLLRRLAHQLGYRLLVGKRAEGKLAGQESQSSALLIHRRIAISRWSAFRMRLSWIGPIHKLKRSGRTFVQAVAGGIRVVVFHGPTDGFGVNKAAWRETINRMKRLAANPASIGRPLVILGDTNSRWTDRRENSMRDFAKDIGGQVVHAAPYIDYAVVRGIEAKAFTGDKLGSDHKYVVIKLRWP